MLSWRAIVIRIKMGSSMDDQRAFTYYIKATGGISETVYTIATLDDLYANWRTLRDLHHLRMFEEGVILDLMVGTPDGELITIKTFTEIV